MTRKRYIKLLMSEGADRNRANAMADLVLSRKLSYAEAYPRDVKILRGIDPFLLDVWDGLKEAIQPMVEAISQIVESASQAVSAFGSAFSVAMQGPRKSYRTCPKCGGRGVILEMQAMAQIGGMSIRGPDVMKICPACFGTGKQEIYT